LSKYFPHRPPKRHIIFYWIGWTSFSRIKGSIRILPALNQLPRLA
jgi:hypothetical protein